LVTQTQICGSPSTGHPIAAYRSVKESPSRVPLTSVSVGAGSGLASSLGSSVSASRDPGAVFPHAPAANASSRTRTRQSSTRIGHLTVDGDVEAPSSNPLGTTWLTFSPDESLIADAVTPDQASRIAAMASTDSIKVDFFDRTDEDADWS
jgi:hypothetical protein